MPRCWCRVCGPCPSTRRHQPGLPDPEERAKDLGIMNVGSAGPQALAPLAASLVISSLGGYPVLFGLAGVTDAGSAPHRLPGEDPCAEPRRQDHDVPARWPPSCRGPAPGGPWRRRCARSRCARGRTAGAQPAAHSKPRSASRCGTGARPCLCPRRHATACDVRAEVGDAAVAVEPVVAERAASVTNRGGSVSSRPRGSRTTPR